MIMWLIFISISSMHGVGKFRCSWIQTRMVVEIIMLPCCFKGRTTWICFNQMVTWKFSLHLCALNSKLCSCELFGSNYYNWRVTFIPFTSWKLAKEDSIIFFLLTNFIGEIYLLLLYFFFTFILISVKRFFFNLYTFILISVKRSMH